MKNEKINNSKIKVGKILFTLTMSKYLSSYQTWYLPLKEYATEMVFFDTYLNKILYGKKRMNEKFLEFIRDEKPDYVHMGFGQDEFDLDVLLKIREISPKTKTLVVFGDDDFQFEKYSRYLALFVDYGLIPPTKYLKKYREDGLNNIFEVSNLDNNFFKNLNLQKEYDVTFIGMPLTKESGRYDLIKFLKEKKINLKLFGWGWEKYPEFSDIYGGPLSGEELVEVLNKSKINLCFSKNPYGQPHIKGKVFEGGACKTFVLTEYCEDYEDLFKEGKEIIMFKTKKELLEKINYYLKNEKQREKIAVATYEKIIRKYNVSVNLKKTFKKISKEKITHRKIPKIDKKIFFFSNNDFNRSKEEIKGLLEGYDYIAFTKKGHENLKYKEFLQVYSLMKTKKPLSCCDYYVYRRNLGDYLYFPAEKSFRELNKSDFISFLNLSQILVKKKFFLDNIQKFKKASRGKIDFLNKNNTAFVNFPLVRARKIPLKKYSIMKKAFIFKFFHELYSLYYTKKIFYKSFLPTLLLEIISGKIFLLKYLYDSIKDKSRINKLKAYKNSSKSLNTHFIK